uniref:Uncharacterized protein n=1 Tax=Strigamia maritima TaxID=126957 RepID=T1IYT9_STRMM
MGHQYFLLALLVSCVAVVLCNQSQQQLVKVVENESDKACLVENNVDLSKTFMDFQFCVQSVSQKFQLSLYLSQAPVDPVDAVVKFLCDNPALIQCIKNLQDTLSICLTEEKKQVLADQLKPIYAMMDVICEDNGQPIKDLVEKGSVCLSSKKIAILQCVQDVVSVMTPQNAETFEDFKTEEGCTNAKSIQTCVVSSLDQCEDDTASKFFNKLFDAMLSNSHCAHHVDNSNTV